MLVLIIIIINIQMQVNLHIVICGIVLSTTIMYSNAFSVDINRK
jgi:hypothetical protein